MKRLLILGHGYCAQRFVALHGAHFDAITATRRAGSATGNAAAIRNIVFDGQPTDTLRTALREASDILVTAPPGADGDPFLAVLTALSGSVAAGAHIIYLSTIGVYGDQAGGWVDATFAPNPMSERSQRRLAAEQGWTGFAKATRAALAILRLPGIYGPGRSVIDDLAAGTARRLVKPGQVFNRIHVDDLADAMAQVFGLRFSGILDIVDDFPAPPQDVVTFAAERMGVTPPPPIPFETASLTPMARSFYAENKRVSNARARALLGWQPRYATYREGLSAILKDQGRSGG